MFEIIVAVIFVPMPRRRSMFVMSEEESSKFVIIMTTLNFPDSLSMIGEVMEYIRGKCVPSYEAPILKR